MEILIAMTIITILLGSVVITSFGNQNFLIGGQTNSEAVVKAQELLEQAQSMARKDFRAVNSLPQTNDDIYKKWTVVGPSSNPNDYFTKQISSYVSWTDRNRVNQTVKLTTLLTDFENAIGGDTCNSYLTGGWTSPQTKNSTTNFGTIIGDSDTSSIYPITDIDVYNGKAYVTVQTPNVTLTNTPNQISSPTKPFGADGPTIGAIVWTNPNNIVTADNSTFATASLPNGTSITHYLKATNFGFSIPNGATILGVQVFITRKGSSSTNAVKDNQVRIIKSDGSIGTTEGFTPPASNWSTTNTQVSYGGATSLWGENLSYTDINNSNFGVALSVIGNGGSSSRIASVDNVQIKVTYIKDFYVVSVTNSASPTFVTGLGNNPTISAGFNAVTVDGRYAYVATNSSAGQLQIIDLSTTPPSVVSTLKIGSAGTSVGSSIFYRNGYVYLGLNHTAGGPNEFNVIDVHNPLSPSLSGSLPIGYIVNSIYVKNNYAYVVHPTDTSATNQEQVTVIDLNNPTSPQRLGGYHAPDNSGDGKSMFTVGDNFYLGRVLSAGTNNEFYILDNTTPKDIGTNNPNTPQPKGYELNSSVNGLIVRDYLAFLLTGTASVGPKLQILNITNPGSIPAPTNVTLPNNTVGVISQSMDCEGNNIYVTSVPASGTNLNKGTFSIIAP